MTNHRLLELDALRGGAALAVVCFHYFFHYNEIYGHQGIYVDWAHVGMLGVELFFMISGFVIFWTLNRAKNHKDFLVSRFSRLYPAYWSAIFVTFSAVLIFGLEGREVSFYQALVNLTMVQEYLDIPHVDGVYWTLTIELTFYFWMYLFFVNKLLNKVELIFSCFILVSILHSLNIIEVPDFINKALFLKYIPFFTAGICFYKIFNNAGNKYILHSILAFCLVSTIAIYSFSNFIVFTIFFSTFYLALSGYMSFLTYKPFVFMGSISYSLYLIHQNIGYIIINKFYSLSWNPFFGVLVAITISILLASFSYKYIETPSLKYIRTKYRKKEQH